MSRENTKLELQYIRRIGDQNCFRCGVNDICIIKSQVYKSLRLSNLDKRKPFSITFLPLHMLVTRKKRDWPQLRVKTFGDLPCI